MAIDKQKIKAKLEKERDTLTEQLKDMGKRDPETNEWEATPEDLGYKDTDQNDIADRFEEYESRSSMMDILESRLESIEQALASIDKKSFGTCEVCQKSIEMARLEANPAATTCKKHIDNA